MALSLDATLQAALDGLERKPIGRIITSSFSSTIPFTGYDFGYPEASAPMAEITSLSGGELFLVAREPSVAYRLRIMYTDADRNQWTETYITLSGGDTGNDSVPNSLNICEKPNGDIAILITTGSTNSCRVVSVAKDGTYTQGQGAVVRAGDSGDLMYEPCIIYNSHISKYQVFIPMWDNSVSGYRIYLHESTDLSTWAGYTNITPASLGTAAKYSRPHALLVSDDDIVLVFDHVTNVDTSSGFETTNVYYIVSQDDGATWSSPTAVTNYTGVGYAARHPSVVEKTTGGIYVTFNDRVTFVTFDAHTDNVVTDCFGDIDLEMIHMYNGKVYTSGAYPGSGNKTLCGVYVVDPEDMSVEAQWTSTTTPGYSGCIPATFSWPWTSHGMGKYVARFIDNSTQMVVFVITYDGVVNTVTHYVIGEGDGEGDIPAWSLDENLAIPHPSGTGAWSIQHTWVDATAERVYIYLWNGYYWTPEGCYGYIDLTEPADPGTGYYTWHEIWRKMSVGQSTQWGLNAKDCLDFGYSEYDPNSGRVIMCNGQFQNCVMVMDVETGVIQFFKNYNSDKDMPYNGLSAAYVYENKIYGSFTYTALYGQEAWRGLWIYDMVTNSKVLCRPGYEIKDQYRFYAFDFNDISNYYVWMASGDGAIRFHTGSQTFEQWDSKNLPGFNMGLADAYCSNILYDPNREEIWVTASFSYGQPWAGIRRFNLNGDYYQGQYLVGTKTGTDLGLGAQYDLTYGYFERDMSPTVDLEDHLWVVWDHVDIYNDDRDIYWDHDVSEVDVSNDLVETLQLSWDIEIPGELVFNLANGHLYDQQNYLSSRSYLFRRGRRVTVQLGENIADVDYWVDQGTFIVEEAKLRYVRGEYPIIEIIARDLTSLWRDARITLTEYYDGDEPKAIVEGLLDDWTVIDVAEYNIPTFAYSHQIWQQWSDQTLYEIIKDILDHFGYAFFFAVDGVFTPTQIDFSKAVDHVYTDLTHISEYTPDSSFSTFINQIRVIGETHDFIDVVYDAELITSVNGTCGWWNETIDHKVWYNEERTKTCRNPFLDANISTKDFKYFIFKGGGGEEITEIDEDELYCVVEIEGPNLIPVVVGLAISLVVVGTIAILCTYVCGPFIFATNLLVSALCYAVLSTATYDIEVYAHPVGKEKQSIQYMAIDDEEMNIVNQQPVVEEIEDFLCYSAAECQRVAEFELNILKYQRKRIRLSKLGHLQDQILDMVTVKHPYSTQTMQLMIANLKRTLTIKGSMIDTLEGWRIA